MLLSTFVEPGVLVLALVLTHTAGQHTPAFALKDVHTAFLALSDTSVAWDTYFIWDLIIIDWYYWITSGG